MDIALTDKLDFLIEDNTIAEQANGETTMIQAFFSDARVKGQRGYWLDIQLSEIWKYDQSRLTDEVARELRETSKEIADSLVEQGLYNRIETDAYVDSGVMTLEIRCYDNKQLVANKKFAI